MSVAYLLSGAQHCGHKHVSSLGLKQVKD